MFINYSDREVKLLDYRLPNAIVCDVQDILHAISIDSEEALCATVESLESDQFDMIKKQIGGV